jgi:hypothetical protein
MTGRCGRAWPRWDSCFVPHSVKLMPASGADTLLHSGACCRALTFSMCLFLHCFVCPLHGALVSTRIMRGVPVQLSLQYGLTAVYCAVPRCVLLPLQGTLPAGVDQRYLSGFLAREIDRAAERAHDTSSSSISGRAAAPSGSALLQAVLVRYGQLLGVAHLALSGHRLAELQQEGLAGTQQVGCCCWL